MQHCISASALLFAGMPAQADKLPERVVIVELCIAQQSPERVEAVLTNPVEKLLIGLPGVKTLNSITGHGGARFEVHFEDDAGEDDAGSVVQALDGSEPGRGAVVLSRSVQLGQPLTAGQAFGHAVCAEAKRR
ncbi:hypothetical protein JN27_02375 [Massilia sp. BSC265]|nr:hypothetical protein JN27_02375 [Massilia sp. BSC265]